MDWHLPVAALAGAVQVSSIVPYVRDMLRGTTRPNVVSWSLWTLLQVIAIFAQLSAGASWSIVLLFAMTFNTSLVVVLCLMGYGYTKYGLVDYACFAFALGAILLWQATNEPLVALVLAVVADLIAALPTIVKTIRDPYSEIPLAWSLGGFSGLLGIISLTRFDVANLIYPVYILVTNALIACLAFFGREPRHAQS
jgi:hypothetical protein